MRNHGLPSSFGVVGAATVVIVSIFLILPLLVIVLSSFGTDAYLAFPPSGFTTVWYRRLLDLSEFLASLGVSVRLAIAVAVLSSFGGVLAAYAFGRVPVLRKSGAESLFLMPIILPSLVIGLALLVLFNRLGISNAWLMLTLGHVAIALPIVLQMSTPLVATVDRNVEAAAMTLGARPGTVLRKIVLPLLRPAIAGGIVLSFALSFDEFVIATLLSNGGVTTFPVQLFQYMRFSINPTVAAISAMLIAITGLLAWALHRLMGLETLFGLPSKRN
jgi:putative spermidine/putrescine transport system permease protein